MTAVLPHLVFDLDGTLVDGAAVFVDILNEMLAERGSSRVLTIADARPFLSLGGPALVGGTLAEECGDLTREVVDFRERYAARVTSRSSVYEGVQNGLHELASCGFTLAICSNKPQNLCEKVLSDVGLAHLFQVIVGSTPGRRAKPAPDLMDLTLSKLRSSPSRAVLIGDSEVDHALAQATGVPFLFVSYGYAAEGWDSSTLVQFSRFAELVAALRDEHDLSTPLRNVA